MSARRKQIAGSKLQLGVGRRNPDGTTTLVNRDGERNGHCGHEPHCKKVGVADERDPLGHCRCGERLLDAAPDMLAALEECSGVLRGFPVGSLIRERVAAAIKKAKGER